MNFRFKILVFILITAGCSYYSFSQELYIYRPDLEEKTSLGSEGLRLHGDYFFHLHQPGTFPSYNDLSGPEDRWNFGFHNHILLGRRSRFLAQLVTHDDGGKRTKFDWHFSLRHRVFDNLSLIIGHDSNHDSDYQSILNGRVYYLNRNYIGFGIPVREEGFFGELFTWFFHHTNQRGHLDYSGEKLKQEYGFRTGAELTDGIIVSIQVIGQSEAYFSWGQSLLADLIVRIRLFKFAELSLGGGIWKDLNESRLSQKLSYHKIIWGIAFPF